MKEEETELFEEYDFSQARQGPIVPPEPNTTQVTLRLRTDILDWFREQVNARGGGSYQSLINEALQEYIQSQEDSFPVNLRRVIREELQLVTTSGAE